MCIALFSTAHPSFAFILLSNRDEYLTRPTLRADWWHEPDDHILAGRDLQRDVQGTWLGITRQGRLAVLTNFREEGQVIEPDARSRGEIPKSFLTLPKSSETSPEEWVRRLLAEGDIHGVGGFSLLFGDLRPGRQQLGVLSNRTTNVEEVTWLAKSSSEVHGLSNALFEDQAWQKVIEGKKLLRETLYQSFEQKESDEQLLKRLFDVLSHKSLPERREGQSWSTYSRNLRRSIFIPPIDGGTGDENASLKQEKVSSAASCTLEAMNNFYGTQKQTVILVDHEGRVRFVERTLFDNTGQSLPSSSQDESFTFDIDEWTL